MGYIYCITNLINGKRYIGKTTETIEERWKEHCKDSQKDSENKRPLYDAFNKYGIENFKIEQIEELDNSELNNREIYWIKELNTYGHNGYNATKGGDGKILYDHNEILELYQMGYSVSQVSEKVKCDRSQVTKVLRAHGIKSRGSSRIIEQYDMADNYIQQFDSSKEAEAWLIDHGFTTSLQAHNRIIQCCKGERSSIYNYKWKYKPLPE